MLVVVFGPQTRLGREVLETSWPSGTTFLLVTRHESEYEAVRLAHPEAALYRAWEPAPDFVDERDAVVVVCCAFGPIHPGAATSDDLRNAEVDWRALDAILRKYSGVPLQLLLISTVLALCPRPGREYYAGWKNVTEGFIREVVGRRRGASLAAFYPGRLVDRKSLATPISLLYTSYRQLADKIVSSVRQHRSYDAVVGVDARLWLAVRSVRLGWSALTGRR